MNVPGQARKNSYNISVLNTPKKLKEERETLFNKAFETGLSSTSLLHDFFVNIEGMTPA